MEFPLPDPNMSCSGHGEGLLIRKVFSATVAEQVFTVASSYCVRFAQQRCLSVHLMCTLWF